jgi:hypothetical protein
MIRGEVEHYLDDVHRARRCKRDLRQWQIRRRGRLCDTARWERNRRGGLLRLRRRLAAARRNGGQQDGNREAPARHGVILALRPKRQAG